MKKIFTTLKDKKEWELFIKDMGSVSDKETYMLRESIKKGEVAKLDLHGYSLIEANTAVKQFIIESFNSGQKKIIIITGKGSRSKSHDNPYISDKLSVLKNSVPEYIKRDQELSSKINSISQADKKNGGDGALYINLKNK